MPNKLPRVTITIAILSLIGQTTSAQPALRWSRHFGYESTYDDASAMIQTFDGGFLVAGTSFEDMDMGSTALCVRTDQEGHMEWQFKYGTPDDYAEFYDAVETADSGFVLTALSEDQPLLMRLDATGNQIWARQYQSQLHGVGRDIVTADDSGFTVAGTCRDIETRKNFYLAKFDTAGALLWERTYVGGPENDECSGAIQTADAGFLLAGSLGHYDNIEGRGWLVKTNSQGEKEWDQIYRLADHHIGMDHPKPAVNGNVLLVCSATLNDDPTDLVQPYLMMLNDSGDTLWTHLYEQVGWQVRCGIVTPEGEITLSGSCPDEQGNYQVLLAKTDSIGEVKWSTLYGGADYEESRAILCTNDGGYALAGSTYSPEMNPADDFLLMKTESDANSVASPSIVPPLLFVLSPPYPNPFNSTVRVSYGLLQAADVKGKVFDLFGREVATLVNCSLPMGNHTVIWNAEGFASGIYLVKMETPKFRATKMVTLIK